MMTDLDYIRICEIIAEKSHSTRSKVGAVLVKDDNIISFGYNGTPAGFDNVCEDECGNTKSEVLHAESNAIVKCAKSANSTIGSTLFTTYSPCIECAKLIIQARIKRVVYQCDYRSFDGITLLRKAGIIYEKISNSATGV